MTKSVNGETVEYKYQENSDQLVAFGNETFEYDGVGNPTRYRNMTAEWSRGRVLTRLTDGTNTVEYTYDGRGYRTSKKVIGANATYTVTYIYAEGKLLREETGTKTIDYIYGSSGIIGIKRNGERYLFRKNMFGDVTHIYNESGEIVGEYSYTAFGECTVDLDVGGIVGLKSILGVKSRRQAIEILDKLTELGYIEYEIDKESKRER